MLVALLSATRPECRRWAGPVLAYLIIVSLVSVSVYAAWNGPGDDPENSPRDPDPGLLLAIAVIAATIALAAVYCLRAVGQRSPAVCTFFAALCGRGGQEADFTLRLPRIRRLRPGYHMHLGPGGRARGAHRDMYEALRALDARNVPPPSRTATPAQIRRLPIVTHRAPSGKHGTADHAGDKHSSSVAPAGGDDLCGDPEHTCAVCLDSFVDGDRLRLLPCFHRYHPPCIDPWLASNSTCPVCKHNALHAGPDGDDDTGQEEPRWDGAGVPMDSEDEASHLLRALALSLEDRSENS